MTPAEWLAVLFITSQIMSVLWSSLEPGSLTVKFHSNMRLLVAVATQIAALVLSLAVLSASLLATVSVLGVLLLAVVLRLGHA